VYECRTPELEFRHAGWAGLDGFIDSCTRRGVQTLCVSSAEEWMVERFVVQRYVQEMVDRTKIWTGGIEGKQLGKVPTVKPTLPDAREASIQDEAWSEEEPRVYRTSNHLPREVPSASSN